LQKLSGCTTPDFTTSNTSPLLVATPQKQKPLLVSKQGYRSAGVPTKLCKQMLQQVGNDQPLVIFTVRWFLKLQATHNFFLHSFLPISVFKSNLATASEEAGFCPVINKPSCSANEPKSAPLL
jgi:hypothetical protein